MTATAERKRLAARARKAKIGKRIKHSTGRPKAPIRPEEVYAIEVLNDLFGIGEFTLREAEAKGLKPFWMGKRKYVKGAELIRHMEQTAKG